MAIKHNPVIKERTYMSMLDIINIMIYFMGKQIRTSYIGFLYFFMSYLLSQS